MPTYLVNDTQEKKRTLVEANSSQAAERRVAGDRYQIENIKDPAAVGKLMGEGVKFLAEGAEAPPADDGKASGDAEKE